MCVYVSSIGCGGRRGETSSCQIDTDPERHTYFTLFSAAITSRFDDGCCWCFVAFPPLLLVAGLLRWLEVLLLLFALLLAGLEARAKAADLVESRFPLEPMVNGLEKISDNVSRCFDLITGWVG